MRASPSSPLPAVSTSYPSRVSRVSSDSRIAASSSITRMAPAVGDDESTELRCGITTTSDIYCLSSQGEIQKEGCARTRVAFHAYLASVFLNDAVGDRKPQSGPARLSFFGCGLGGEERIVNTMNIFLSDAAAGVGN